MASVYVTGSSGQLGSCLRDLAPNFTYIDHGDLDLSTPEKIPDFFSGKNVDIIIHTAAYTQVDKAESERDIARKVNAEATGVLAKYCKLFFTVSTDYVYEGRTQTPLKEDDSTSPVNFYGESKLLGEQLAMKNNPNTWIFRTSWLFSEYGHNFVKTMQRLGKEKTELNVVNDQLGSPTYARDLAEYILKAIDKKLPSGIYNFSNSGETNWCEFAQKILQFSGIETPVHGIASSQYPTPAKRPSYSCMDTSKISAQLGKPRHWEFALQDCLRRMQ